MPCNTNIFKNSQYFWPRVHSKSKFNTFPTFSTLFQGYVPKNSQILELDIFTSLQGENRQILSYFFFHWFHFLFSFQNYWQVVTNCFFDLFCTLSDFVAFLTFFKFSKGTFFQKINYFNRLQQNILQMG